MCLLIMQVCNLHYKKGIVILIVFNYSSGHSIEHRIATGEYTMREAWNSMYDVNVTGAQILTHTFVPLLLKSKDARLLFLTSGTAQLGTMYNGYYPGPPPASGWPKRLELSPHGYRSSKTGLNMMMLTWYWMLKEDGVKVWSISPGLLATNLIGSKERMERIGARHPSIGGVLIKSVIEGERDADVGKVVADHGIQSF